MITGCFIPTDFTGDKGFGRSVSRIGICGCEAVVVIGSCVFSKKSKDWEKQGNEGEFFVFSSLFGCNKIWHNILLLIKLFSTKLKAREQEKSTDWRRKKWPRKQEYYCHNHSCDREKDRKEDCIKEILLLKTLSLFHSLIFSFSLLLFHKRLFQDDNDTDIHCRNCHWWWLSLLFSIKYFIHSSCFVGSLFSFLFSHDDDALQTSCLFFFIHFFPSSCLSWGTLFSFIHSWFPLCFRGKSWWSWWEFTLLFPFHFFAYIHKTSLHFFLSLHRRRFSWMSSLAQGVEG